jgi:hypothetical protein
VMGWSGPGILISLPLLVLVSIALLTVLVTVSTRHRPDTGTADPARLVRGQERDCICHVLRLADSL